MGQEAACHALVETPDGARESDGKALLENTEIVFRGSFRLRVPFDDISEVAAADGTLTLAWPGGRAVFALGPAAAKWAEKIRNPRGLLDKLGVKQGQHVRVIGVQDEDFLALLRARTGPGPFDGADDNDLVFFEADEAAQLAGLGALKSSIKESGAIWVVSPKGKGAPVRDLDVMAAARSAGLVDVKVVGFSPTHTALKLVVPLAARQPARP